MTADAAPMPEDPVALAPLPVTERIAALDVLRGFALLGIFIMNMPGFSHSLFAAPAEPVGSVDATVAVLRELFFAGKFNLLFGFVFGVGFALQNGRLRHAETAVAAREGRAVDPCRPVRFHARRLAFLLAVGLVHAMVFWPGDVLVVYALLGFALLALRGVGDRILLAVLATFLVLPALAEVLRPLVFSDATETIAAFQYQQLEVSNDLAFGHGSWLDAARETARVFAWTLASPLGRLSLFGYFVQMATGIVAGAVVGRRGFAGAPATSLRRWHGMAATLALVATAIATIAAPTGPVGNDAALFVALFARTIGRAALAAFYALSVVRLLHGGALPRWLAPLALAGRMPLTNYLLQTLLASAVFYGWGLGFWGRSAPAAETMLAIALFVLVQVPASAWWLARFRYGPMEYLWRRFTYGRPP